MGEISKKINKIYKTKVLAFEPNKENFKILNKKKSKNIQCFNLALSKKNTFLELTNSKGSSNVLGFKSKEKDMKTKVKAVKLDKFLNYNIQFLKIDVEGAEIQLLEGAKKVLKKFKPNLAISVYHKHNDILEIYRHIESLRVFKNINCILNTTENIILIQFCIGTNKSFKINIEKLFLITFFFTFVSFRKFPIYMHLPKIFIFFTIPNFF